MDLLPVEVKHLVAEKVSEVSQDALRALLQVNRQWNQIVAPGLYKDLTIHLEAGELPHHVIQLLDASLILSHVRHLTLVAQYPRYVVVEHASLSLASNDKNLGKYLDETLPEDINIPQLSTYQGDWTPIIRLVPQLVRLQRCDILLCANYPSALLDVLAETHPHCLVSVFPLCQFDPKEDLSRSEWVHSPILHSVQVICHVIPNHWVFTEHPDRVLRDLLRQATHIKRLSLQISATPGGSSRHRYARWLQAQPLESEIDAHPRAQLEILSLPLMSKMTTEQFHAWSRVTDLGCLTAWTAGGVEDVSLLASIAELQPFRALERLTLSLNPPENAAAYSPAVKAMFDALPPLTYLCLLGTYDPGWLPTAVLDRHGPTLAELQLHRRQPRYQNFETYWLARKGQIAPVFPANVIARAAARCPVLRTLRICVQRHRGHPVETAAYDALGLFPALRTLDLVLNCLPVVVPSHGTPFPPRELSAYEQEPIQTSQHNLPKWTIRDCAINSAFDEALATAIFTRIRTGQGQGTGGSLRVLRLHPLVGLGGQYQRLTGITMPALLGGGDCHHEMGGAWQVEWDGAGGRAENRAKPCRQWGGLMRAADVEIFESIWPSDREPKIWPLEWHSWPLQ